MVGNLAPRYNKPVATKKLMFPTPEREYTKIENN